MNTPISPARRRTGHIKEFLRRLLCAVVNINRAPFYFILAAVMTFAVECLSRHSLVDTLQFLVNSPLAYLSNYGIILLTILPALLFRKRMAGLAFLSAIWTLLGIAQCIVLLVRVSPLAAIDIAIAFSVITIIEAYLSPFQIILICVGLLSVLAGLVILFIRAKRHIVYWRHFAIVYLSTVTCTVLVMMGGFATGQLSDQFPNLANAYNDYGFPFCFSMSVVKQGIDRPSHYGSSQISGIVDNLPEESGTPAVGEDGRKPNVIMVQLESFFDVKYLEGVTYSADPIPGFTALKEQYPSGSFTIPVIGAGTINTEFEVLTGMNVADFGAGELPFRTVLADATCETIAYDLLASGYRTHAIHNHEGSFYLRNEVYPNLGFESFTSIEYFENPTFNENDWAHDALLTDEILHILQSTEESDFVYAVSVQGHGKYPDEYTPKDEDVVITGGIEDDAVRSHYNYYINQLREMDAFITALYEAVMAMEEDTVLIFYGDHLPIIALDEGITFPSDDHLTQTEYIIIANYETPVEAADEDLYAYQLFPTVMEIIGNDTGVINRFHRAYRDDPAYLSYLEILSYDALYGDSLATGGVAYPPTDMVMGHRPIRVTGAYAEGEYLYVTGENFTEYSRVALDGWNKSTEFVDANTLRIQNSNPDKLLEKTEQITVRQISQTNEELSETPPYIPPQKEDTES